MKDVRTPFAEAIEEPLLFRKQFYGDGTPVYPGLSFPQRVALKIFYGLPLSAKVVDEKTGFNELNIWAAFQGGAKFDHLGYPISFEDIPYVPKEYEAAVLIFGRRSGKTTGFISFIEAYEAGCGGHLEYVGRKQECALFFTAQKQEFASDFISQFVLPLLEDSPLLAKRILGSNSDGIRLSSGIRGVSKTLGIRPAPPNIKAFRGPAIPVIGMDEAAFWYKDAESANPDFEVERAVDKAQGQFPHRKKAVGSTPWTKEGIVWEAHNAGTLGRKHKLPEKRKKYKDTLVLHAPTPTLANPLLDRVWFQSEFDKDPEAYYREILAQFVDAVEGMFAESLLRAAIKDQPSTFGAVEKADRPVMPREPRIEFPDDPEPFYVAAMDPAFKRDAFGFTIMHHDAILGVVQDVVRRWKAANPKHPLKIADVLDELTPLLKRYRITNVLSDQYQLEALQQLMLDRGFSVEGVTFTAREKAKIYGSLHVLLREGKLKLLDDEETFQELLLLQKTHLPQGGLHISAPVGKHDDMATVAALAASRTIWLLPIETPAAKAADESVHARVMKQVIQRREAASRVQEDYYDDGDEDDE